MPPRRTLKHTKKQTLETLQAQFNAEYTQHQLCAKKHCSASRKQIKQKQKVATFLHHEQCKSLPFKSLRKCSDRIDETIGVTKLIKTQEDCEYNYCKKELNRMKQLVKRMKQPI
jgi:hypothetical protein